MSMYPRSEFPTEVMPPIMRTSGTINRAAIAMRFSAAGCPHGNVAVTVAAIQSGADVNVAFQLGMLVYYANEMSVPCMERVTNWMLHGAKKRHAEKHPRGFWAAAAEALGLGAFYLPERDPKVQAAWEAAVRAAHARPAQDAQA